MSFLNVFGLAMAVIYAALGIFLLFAPGVFVFTEFQRIGLGILLLAYGLFRLYNIYKRKKENDLEEDEE